MNSVDKTNSNHSNENIGVISCKPEVLFTETIEIVIGNCDRFLKKDSIRANKVERLQCVARFSSDNTLIYSILTNRIRNNPISRRDMNIYNKILSKSIYVAKGKRTMKQLGLINASS